MRYKTVIFDMDGTILDTSIDLMNSVNFAISEFGYKPISLAETKKNLGFGSSELIRLSMDENENPDIIEKAHFIFKKHYAIHAKDNTKPYPGIIDLLETLKRSKVNIAVVSNKPDDRVKELVEVYFKDMFDYAIGQKESILKKPAPDMLDMAINFFKAKKEDVLYIGDSEIDIMTATNAQVDNISVDWGFRSKEELVKANASNIVDSVVKIKEIIL